MVNVWCTCDFEHKSDELASSNHVIFTIFFHVDPIKEFPGILIFHKLNMTERNHLALLGAGVVAGLGLLWYTTGSNSKN